MVIKSPGLCISFSQLFVLLDYFNNEARENNENKDAEDD